MQECTKKGVHPYALFMHSWLYGVLSNRWIPKMGWYQAGKVKMAGMAKNGKNSETFLNSKGVLYFLENFRKSCHSLPFLAYGWLKAVASKMYPIGYIYECSACVRGLLESKVLPMGNTFPSTESQARGTDVYRREQRFTL